MTKMTIVVLTMKEKVKIVSRLKEGKWRKELAEGYGVGTATLWDIKKSAEWILKFVSVPSSEDGSSTGQTVRRAENGTVQDAVGKWFL